MRTPDQRQSGTGRAKHVRHLGQYPFVLLTVPRLVEVVLVVEIGPIHIRQQCHAPTEARALLLVVRARIIEFREERDVCVVVIVKPQPDLFEIVADSERLADNPPRLLIRPGPHRRAAHHGGRRVGYSNHRGSPGIAGNLRLRGHLRSRAGAHTTPNGVGCGRRLPCPAPRAASTAAPRQGNCHGNRENHHDPDISQNGTHA
jgi:hypothetical protein